MLYANYNEFFVLYDFFCDPTGPVKIYAQIMYNKLRKLENRIKIMYNKLRKLENRIKEDIACRLW